MKNLTTNKKHNKIMHFVSILLIVLVAFKTVDFILSEITDIWAYEDAIAVNDNTWNDTYNKICNNETLTSNDYDLIFSQTGLGKPAVDSLLNNNEINKIEEYRNYYLLDKNYSCVREGVFACHEFITDNLGNAVTNPQFADLQNGDIIITLSIHSLGWRHGHAAIVVDAENGTTAQAVMIGEKSAFGTVDEWDDFPLVAVLRAKNLTENERNEVAQFASNNLIGLDYFLFAGIFGGRNAEKIPSATQCAHYVWYAYNRYGIDIDCNGGQVITPKDILHSEELEIVQVYGNIKEI